MACMEATRALKSSSLLGEINYVQEQNMSFVDYHDDFFHVGVVGSGEDFHVEELLDFSNGEFQEEEEQEGGVVVEEEEEKDSSCVVSQDYCVVDDDDNSNYSTSFSSNLDSQSLLDTELGVPMDHIKELEWVSLMVEDNTPDFFHVFGKAKTENCTNTQSEPVFPSCFPVKARTKRPRSSRFGKQQLLMSPPSESSSTSSCSSGHSSVSCLTVTNNIVPSMVCVTGPSEPEKKKKKPNHAIQTGTFQFQRRCSHCGVQKTPQWRTGPLGAKTLCNACGVRYKSGRLFPEYRPACSPTFSAQLHSNSHRKVLEMRKGKEMPGMTSGSTHVEPIF